MSPARQTRAQPTTRCPRRKSWEAGKPRWFHRRSHSGKAATSRPRPFGVHATTGPSRRTPIPIKSRRDRRFTLWQPRKDCERPPSGSAKRLDDSDRRYPDQSKAVELLSRAKSESGKTLTTAQAFTEKVQKGSETLYRARFTGLEADSAERAAKLLNVRDFLVSQQKTEAASAPGSLTRRAIYLWT